MARPLRILVAGGWYQVTSRRNRREAIYRTEADRRRFLGLVSELPVRFELEVHAFAAYTEPPVRTGRMDNPWTELIGGLVLGSEEYARELLMGLKTGLRCGRCK
jgi:hypothetical protein